MLPNGELPRNRHDILVDVQGRPHKMMLAHHHIKVYFPPACPASTPTAQPAAVPSLLQEDRRDGERIVAWTTVLMGVVLVPTGVITLISGDSGLHFVGIAMLVLALVVAAVPISPILQALVRRRQQTSGSH